jgi:hypothetical protein
VNSWNFSWNGMEFHGIPWKIFVKKNPSSGYEKFHGIP